MNSRLQEMGLRERMDAEVRVPNGKNYALSCFHVRPGESAADMQQRVISVVTAMSKAPGFHEQRLWTAVSRSPAERGKAQHASKLRRLLFAQQGHAQNATTEFDEGEIRVAGRIIGSAMKEKPSRGTIVQGKTAGAWVRVDIAAVAELTGKAEEIVKAEWEGVWNPRG